MAAARIIRVLPADLFAALEYRRGRSGANSNTSGCQRKITNREGICNMRSALRYRRLERVWQSNSRASDIVQFNCEPLLNWIDLTSSLAENDVPNFQSVPSRVAGACAIVTAARKSVARWIDAQHADKSIMNPKN